MKLLVFSDSHGMPLYMRETLEKHRDVDAVIFLGDGQNDFQMMRALFPNIAFYSVRGNCDLGCADVPVREILDLDGAKIFCTHGHLYHVSIPLCAPQGRRVRIFCCSATRTRRSRPTTTDCIS